MGRDGFSPRESPTRAEYILRRQLSKKTRTCVVGVLLICCIYFMVNFAHFVPSSYIHQGDRCVPCSTDVGNKSNSRGKPGVKLGKVSMLYGKPSPHYVRALRSHELHAELHGYPMFVLRSELIDGIWSKPAYIMQLVMQELQKPSKERLEWFFWADADTYIVNPLIPLEAYLPPRSLDHIHILHGNDHNGLNFGVFFIRVSPWTLRFLSDVLSLRHYNPDQELRFEEQSAVAHLIKTTQMYASAAAVIPQRWVNAYMGPRRWDGTLRKGGSMKPNSIIEGDLLVHFAGHSKQKETRMTWFMNKQEKRKNVWQIPFKKTHLPEEIKQFWSKYSTPNEAEQSELSHEKTQGNVLEVDKDKEEQEVHQEVEADKDKATEAGNGEEQSDDAVEKDGGSGSRDPNDEEATDTQES